MHSLFDNYVQTFVFVVACLLVSALPNIVGIVAWHIGWQTSICCACSVADITTSSYMWTLHNDVICRISFRAAFRETNGFCKPHMWQVPRTPEMGNKIWSKANHSQACDAYMWNTPDGTVTQILQNPSRHRKRICIRDVSLASLQDADLRVSPVLNVSTVVDLVGPRRKPWASTSPPVCADVFSKAPYCCPTANGLHSKTGTASRMPLMKVGVNPVNANGSTRQPTQRIKTKKWQISRTVAEIAHIMAWVEAPSRADSTQTRNQCRWNR